MTLQPQIRVVRSSESLKAVSYNDTTVQPPIPITVLTPPRPSKFKRIAGLGKSRLPSSGKCSPDNVLPERREDDRRDSGLAPSSSTARNSKTTLNTEVDSNQSLRQSPSLPQLSTLENSECRSSTPLKKWDNLHQGQPEIPPVSHVPFVGLVTEIPTGSFDDLSQPNQIEFSNRGSMLLGGKKANPANGSLNNGLPHRRKPSVHLSPPTHAVPKRVLSADEQMLSNQVRLMYEDGVNQALDPMARARHINDDLDTSSTDVSRNVSTPYSIPEHPTERAIGLEDGLRSPPGATRKTRSPPKEAKELAGGIEDWDDVGSGDVDRYGFIVPQKASQDPSVRSGIPQSPDPPRLQRVSTALKVASEAPRRNRSRAGRAPLSSRSPARSTSAFSSRRPSSRNDRPPSSQSSLRDTVNGTQSKIRSTANKLPHRRNHRYLDEAGDMLTLPPGLADINENQEDSRAAEDAKYRERNREEKWHKMARMVNGDDNRGGGMIFDFDTKSPKLIERTWKGIPDRWRATAWHAFVTSSAKRRGGFPSDDNLKADFHKLLEQASPDDVQIDIDVPRTINSHIMFRRRYRGGQRLLFRVLHCLSIYFPDTGYVQGMAALAATLLCYFDEEMAFVMLVRLWQLRGLERLYQSGFEGLMQALEEFEKRWLADGEVSQKLVSSVRSSSGIGFWAKKPLQKVLDIFPTAYGTRWYLTLFNYSIPFPAQLRVWDVFMLLGDPDETTLTTVPRTPGTSTNVDAPKTVHETASDISYHGGLDVLHAVSAALIDGTREILLDSDFENAMKVLTSWIPIRDEELLMRVAKAEWKMHRRKK